MYFNQTMHVLDIILLRKKSMQFYTDGTGLNYVQVFRNRAFWRIEIKAVLTCEMFFGDFPFDNQVNKFEIVLLQICTYTLIVDPQYCYYWITAPFLPVSYLRYTETFFLLGAYQKALPYLLEYRKISKEQKVYVFYYFNVIHCYIKLSLL